MHFFVHGGNLRLNPLLHIAWTDFTIDQGIDNLVVEMVTSGKGRVQLTDVQIEQNRNDLGQICAYYLICVLFFDFFLIHCPAPLQGRVLLRSERWGAESL
jgi:hypothetical protein